MDNFPPPPTATLYPAYGLWCPRKLCQRRKTCGYVHSCKAMTREVAAATRAQWEADKVRREEIAAQEEQEAQQCRDRRNSKINAMLETHDLNLCELEEWVKDVQNGR